MCADKSSTCECADANAAQPQLGCAPGHARVRLLLPNHNVQLHRQVRPESDCLLKCFRCSVDAASMCMQRLSAWITVCHLREGWAFLHADILNRQSTYCKSILVPQSGGLPHGKAAGADGGQPAQPAAQWRQLCRQRRRVDADVLPECAGPCGGGAGAQVIDAVSFGVVCSRALLTC